MLSAKGALEISKIRLETGVSFLHLIDVDKYTLEDVKQYSEAGDGSVLYITAENNRQINIEYLKQQGIHLARRAMIGFGIFNDEGRERALPFVAGHDAGINDLHWDIWNDYWGDCLEEFKKTVYPDYAEAVIFRKNKQNNIGLKIDDDEITATHVRLLGELSQEMPDTKFILRQAYNRYSVIIAGQSEDVVFGNNK